MTEPTNTELNEFIATRVMGWHKESDGGAQYWWVDAENERKWLVDDGNDYWFGKAYRPAEDIAQAIECLKLLETKQVYQVIAFLESQAREAGGSSVLFWLLWCTNMPRVLCLAIKVAVEGKG